VLFYLFFYIHKRVTGIHCQLYLIRITLATARAKVTFTALKPGI